MNSAKLKRKLGDLGVDTSSKRANENFCLVISSLSPPSYRSQFLQIGTPLPPLEKSRDTGEFVPLWKQEVRDEKGRRRLHGAFTGGFSAGYFNSVGSKEGWTPSTFVSSRSDRAKARTARPEDFMDEEDLTELRADQKLVSEHDEMDILGGTQAERARKTGVDDSQKDSITLALEQAMLPSPKDSAGGRILKKMGWRPGQGIGPRVTWRQREIQHGRDPDKTGPDVDEEAKKHTYAPKDTPVIVVLRKDDFHGLGYNRSLGLHASLGVHEQGAQGAQEPRLAGGFGLGALNDADEDDLDVYDHAIGHGRSRHAFDVNDMHDEERVVIGGRGAKSSSTTVRTPSIQANSPGVFRDGKPVLPGFKLSEKPVAEVSWFPLPEVPKGWKSDPKALWERERATLSEKENIPHFPVPGQPQRHAQWKIGISPDQRGAALGETPLPSAPRSVFEYMSKKDQERIKTITASRFTGPSTVDTTKQEPTPSTLPSQGPYIFHIEPHVAQAALQGFQPFTSNPNKQSRYTTYLRAHAEPGSGTSMPARLQTQTPETYALEMSEFAKAAALYRPVSGAMAGRFTSAAVLELGPKIVEGLHTPAEQASMEREQEPIVEDEEEKKEEEPKVHAARLGMYGSMTREVKPWQPARLLCKRFGVKDPNAEVHFDTAEASTSANADVPTGGAGGVETGSVTEVQPSPTVPRGQRDLANIGLGEDDGQGDDILTYERPPMSIFKAIFASDDEESEDEEDKSPGDDTAEALMPSQPSTSIQTTEKPAETSVVSPTTTDGAKARATVDEKVDLSTFKPTFVPRDSQPHSGNAKVPAVKEKKGKKSKTGALVSFDVDEDGGESLSILARRETKERDRPKKKRKKHRGYVEDDVWVEKPAPDIVRDLPVERTHDGRDTTEVDDAQGVLGPSRGRKRAVDFL
ncbi:hypothetical protein J3R82DRAFT_2610 [Butyriboletus roseoflavus]|nr:hypothetical protein J3R82DRAFT_2610 [Butyriboletus roseoflavus]